MTAIPIGGVDVVIVGAGVAGAPLAAQLADAGVQVLLLERDEVYADRVRGEGMVQWGYEAAAEMGLIDAITSAPGASVMTRLVAYDELVPIESARSRSRDLSTILPGVPGLVSVGHPEMRAALCDVAVARGAVIRRGVSDVAVTPGATPAVSFSHDGERYTVSCRLVVGADGKESVVRRSIGVELNSTIPRVMLTGMLVDDGGAWDRDEVTIGVHGGDQLYVFPRKGALRLYTARPMTAERLAGPDKADRMLESFLVPSLPHAEAIAASTPIGPCATFPMTDTWTRRPYGPGVVLVGDAAGWSNPITGQGLAIAMRDALVLSRLLIDDRAWTESLLDTYAAERWERMRRLRFASALTDLFAAQGAPDRAGLVRRLNRCARQQPELLRALEAVHAGPWRIDEDAFEPSILTTLALA
ncbi:MAG: FAD-dependent oxidoreductase [Acidimicrobiia bacterium]